MASKPEPKVSVNVGTTIVMIHCNPEEEPEITRSREGSSKSVSRRNSRSPNRLSCGNQNVASSPSTTEDTSPKLTIKNTSISLDEINVVGDSTPTAPGTSEDTSPKLTIKNTSINMNEMNVVNDSTPTALGSPPTASGRPPTAPGTSEDTSPKITIKNTSINMDEINVVEDSTPTAPGSPQTAPGSPPTAPGTPVATYQNPAFHNSIESLHRTGRLRRQISFVSSGSVDTNTVLDYLKCIPAKYRQRDFAVFAVTIIALPIVVALILIYK
uniref:Probable GPI-anchored adhesin-like protein PGA18 n=1 Tax=Diabrotica virgifera virgifera TaxID=50390 RepID=A0A6P7FMA5_DIAVI